MKVVMVVVRLVEEDDVEQLIREEKRNHKPVLSLVADEVGASKWIGDEFYRLVHDRILDKQIQNQRLVMFTR